jgi:anti-sigma B factor antagonist
VRSEPNKGLLEIEMVGDVAVVRFTQRSLLHAETIEALGEQLRQLVENSGCTKFVLNFANVESMTSAMVGKLVTLHNKIETSVGRLALCRIDPFVFQIFTILNLTHVFRIYPEEQQALQSF